MKYGTCTTPAGAGALQDNTKNFPSILQLELSFICCKTLIVVHSPTLNLPCLSPQPVPYGRSCHSVFQSIVTVPINAKNTQNVVSLIPSLCGTKSSSWALPIWKKHLSTFLRKTAAQDHTNISCVPCFAALPSQPGASNYFMWQYTNADNFIQCHCKNFFNFIHLKSWYLYLQTQYLYLQTRQLHQQDLLLSDVKVVFKILKRTWKNLVSVETKSNLRTFFLFPVQRLHSSFQVALLFSKYTSKYLCYIKKNPEIMDNDMVTKII